MNVRLAAAGQAHQLAGQLAQAQALELAAQDARDRVQLIRRHRAAQLKHALLDRAASGHQDEQHPPVRDRHQLQVREHLLVSRGAGHHRGGVVRHAGERLGNAHGQIVHLMKPPVKAAVDELRLLLAQRQGPQHLIDVQAVGLVRWDASGGGVRGVEVAQLLQVAHLVADGGRGELLFIFA